MKKNGKEKDNDAYGAALLTKGFTYINGDLQPGATALFWIGFLAPAVVVFVISPLAKRIAEHEVKTE